MAKNKKSKERASLDSDELELRDEQKTARDSMMVGREVTDPHDVDGPSHSLPPGAQTARRQVDGILSEVNRLVQTARFDEALQRLNSISDLVSDSGLKACQEQVRVAEQAHKLHIEMASIVDRMQRQVEAGAFGEARRELKALPDSHPASARIRSECAAMIDMAESRSKGKKKPRQ